MGGGGSGVWHQERGEWNSGIGQFFTNLFFEPQGKAHGDFYKTNF